MKPKEIRKWFLLLTIALSLVSSEYCSGDKTDTVKYERQRESENVIEKSFRECDSHRLTSKPLHRFQVKNTRELDFIREKVSHRSDSSKEAKTVRNGIQATRRREIPNILKTRSTEMKRYAVSGPRSFRKSDSLVDMPPIRNTRTSQISSEADTLTPQDQAITRKINHKRSDKLHLKENNIMQKENGRYDTQSNRRSHKNQEERAPIFKTNRIRTVNNENRQEQQHSVLGESTGSVSRERLTIRNRSNNRNKKFTVKIEKDSTKNKSFISNAANEIARILNIRSRVHERNFNRLENNRFYRTETINAIRGKRTIRRTDIRSTEKRREETAVLSVTSVNLRRSRITEISDKNNNILRRAVRNTQISLATRDDPQNKLYRNVVETAREELMNVRYMDRNDGILRENLRSRASRVTRFQTTTKLDRSTEQNVRRISAWFRPETTEGRKSRYATYSRSNRLKVISTENRNSKRSVEDRKENRLSTRETDEREYRSKTNNIRRLLQERVVVQVTRNRDNINNHRFGINRRVELKNIGDEKGTILDYGVRTHINIRTNKRYLSRTPDRINVETRKGIEINIAESATRRSVERNNLSIQRLVDRISVISENKYPGYSRQGKEMSNTDQRSFVFSKKRILMYTERDHRKQRQVAEPLKVREVRNFERNTIFRTNGRNTEQRSIKYSAERKVIGRKSGIYQKLERHLRRHSFLDAMQIKKDINLLKLREECHQNTRYHERHITDNRGERMKAARNRDFQLRNNGMLSTERITLRNTGYVSSGKITRNVPSFIRSDENALLNLNMQERMRATERNARGFRGKLDILRRYASNRRMKSSKENESFTNIIKNFENMLSGKTEQDRVLRTERNNRVSENYKLKHLSSGAEGIQSLTDRASRRIGIKASSSVRGSDKRIPGDEMREIRALSERSRRVFGDQQRIIERHDKRKREHVKIQDRIISTEISDVKRNLNRHNDSPIVLRNGRGFRGKHSNFVRLERNLKYNYNRNNLLLTVFYRTQDISVRMQVLKPVENNIRFVASRRASPKFFFDKNTEKIRNYERAFFENQRNIRNNQRALLKNTRKINSNLNILVAQQTPNRNIQSIHRNFQERTIALKSHHSSNRRANDRILSLNQSSARRFDIRIERFLENTRTGSQKTRNRRAFEETKLDNVRQRISNYRFPEDTILPVHGALGSPFISRDITFENRLISSPQIHSSQKSHLNANENWNMRTVLSFTAHIILGLSIVMAASESDPFKCRSFKQRLFDALSLRTEVF